MTKHKDDTVYISNVKLGGYKSIYDMEIDLLPGLNIIIGPNGSGKTNFVEFLWQGFKSASRDFNNEEILFQGTIKDFSGQKPFTYQYELTPTPNSDTFILEYKHSIEKSGHKKDEQQNKTGVHIHPNSFLFIALHSGLGGNLLKISNSIPDLQGITQDTHFKTSGKVNKKNNNRIAYKINGLKINHASTRILIENLCRDFLLSMHENLDLENNLDREYQLSDIKLNQQIIRNLRTYTPIKDMKIKGGYRVLEKNQEFLFDNIGYEYLIEGQWLRWHQLSDGTKRLFYIIAEVTAVEGYGGPILIEEPELGLHPDQLFRLMDFLLEQAENKQIIITTHAPMVLDVLNHNELNRIIITKYDKERGATMRRLTPEQIEAAQNYMDTAGLWLRDYWINSELEGPIVL